MGVSLSRIARGLRVADSTEQQSGTGLKLEFRIQVYGQAPKINVLEGFNTRIGPVPYGAPTHSDMMDLWTPRAYRQSAFPISALAFLAAKGLWNQSKKTQCEAEIAEYRALVMQGVNVAAPTCSQ
jgi:hypothetical protein